MEQIFTQENMIGYTDTELDEFNEEITELLESLDAEPYTDLWYETIKRYSDELARR